MEYSWVLRWIILRPFFKYACGFEFMVVVFFVYVGGIDALDVEVLLLIKASTCTISSPANIPQSSARKESICSGLPSTGK